MPPNPRDVEVVERSLLEPQHQASFAKPWVVLFSDGGGYAYDLEEHARWFQRDYRTRIGLDPDTGEPVAGKPPSA